MSNVAGAIRRLRKQRGLSLVELSKLSGVNPATLSRIENYIMAGSIKSHGMIAYALGIELQELYQDIKLHQKTVKKPKASLKTSHPPNGIFVNSDKASYEILTDKIRAKKMMPVLIKIDVGGKTALGQSPFGTEKFVFTLQGKVGVIVEKETHLLPKNNALYFDASLEHYFINKSKTTAKILCVVTPVGSRKQG